MPSNDYSNFSAENIAMKVSGTPKRKDIPDHDENPTEIDVTEVDQISLWCSVDFDYTYATSQANANTQIQDDDSCSDHPANMIFIREFANDSVTKLYLRAKNDNESSGSLVDAIKYDFSIYAGT